MIAFIRELGSLRKSEVEYAWTVTEILKNLKVNNNNDDCLQSLKYTLPQHACISEMKVSLYLFLVYQIVFVFLRIIPDKYWFSGPGLSPCQRMLSRYKITAMTGLVSDDLS